MPSSGISTERSPVKRKPAWTFWYILTFIISVSHILIVMKLLYLQKYMLKKNLLLVLSELHLYSLSFDDPSISGLPWKCYQILCVPCPPAWPTGTASCSCSFVKLYSSFLSNFTSCRTLRPVPFLFFAHTLSTIPLHGKLVIKNPLKAWLRMAVHNGSITVLVIKPSGRVMKIYLQFIN